MEIKEMVERAQKNWHDLRLMKPKWVFTKTK